MNNIFLDYLNQFKTLFYNKDNNKYHKTNNKKVNSFPNFFIVSILRKVFRQIPNKKKENK